MDGTEGVFPVKAGISSSAARYGCPLSDIEEIGMVLDEWAGSSAVTVTAAVTGVTHKRDAARMSFRIDKAPKKARMDSVQEF